MLSKKHPNIVWFLIDSLRPDLLLEFISLNPDSFISNIISMGVTFDNVITSAPYTITSETSILTGVYPQLHGLDGWFKSIPYSLNKNVICFPEILRELGYYNICIYSYNIRAYVPPYGFNLFQMQKVQKKPNIKGISLYNRALEPKFLLIDFERIHEDSVNSSGNFSKKDYLSSLSILNDDIKQFYKTINNKNDTIFILSSDHGARIVEDIVCEDYKDEIHTGRYLTDKTIKTFFTIIYPNMIPKGIFISKMVRTIDIMPTLLDLLNTKHDFCQGITLLPLIKGNQLIPELAAFSMTGYSKSSPWRAETWSIRSEKWKLIKKEIKEYFSTNYYEYSLFNLEDDPNEINNCIFEYPERTKELTIQLEKHIVQNKKLLVEYYEKADFLYKNILDNRLYPLNIRYKICFNTLFRYILRNRLKHQISYLIYNIKQFYISFIKKLRGKV